MKFKISLYYLVLYLGMGTLMPFISLFLHERGFSGSEIGLILAAGSLSGIVAQPIFGMLNDVAKDYRTILKVSSILSAIGAFGFIFTHAFLPMIIMAILFYFVNAPAGPIVDAIAVERGPKFGFSYGQVRLWGAFGFAFITVIAGYVFSAIGFKYIFISFAFFALILFILIYTFPKMKRPNRQAGSVSGGLSELFLNWRFGLFLSLTLLISAIVTMNFSYLSIYFEKLGYPIDLVGWNFTIAAVVEIPLFWLSARLVRRMGVFPMLVLGTFSYALKYFLLGFAPPVGAVLALQALDGIAFAFYQSSAVEIIDLMAPKNTKATAQTVFAAAGGIAGMIGNVVGGVVIDKHGPQFLFWLMAVVGIIAALLFILFSKKQSEHLLTSRSDPMMNSTNTTL